MAKIRLDSDGRVGHVYIDDVLIQGATEYELQHRSGYVPVLILHVNADMIEYEGDAVIITSLSNSRLERKN